MTDAFQKVKFPFDAAGTSVLVYAYTMQRPVSTGDGVPISLQIANQIKYLVASGRLAPGDEVPPMEKWMIAGRNGWVVPLSNGI
jgi:hypothetical protein